MAPSLIAFGNYHYNTTVTDGFDAYDANESISFAGTYSRSAMRSIASSATATLAPVSGDLLIAIAHNGMNSGAMDSSSPTGWTSLYNKNDAHPRVRAWSRVANGTSADDLVLPSNYQTVIHILNCGQNAAVDTVSVNWDTYVDATSGTFTSGGSGALAQGDDLLIASFSVADGSYTYGSGTTAATSGGATWTPPTGFSNEFEYRGGATPFWYDVNSVSTSVKQLASAASTNAIASFAGAAHANNAICALISIKSVAASFNLATAGMNAA